jgi:hypothetical protein
VALRLSFRPTKNKDLKKYSFRSKYTNKIVEVNSHVMMESKNVKRKSETAIFLLSLAHERLDVDNHDTIFAPELVCH